jgi:hypothetical protein
MLSIMSPRKRHDEAEAGDYGVLFVRNIPKDITAKLKAIAALNRQTLGQYVLDLLLIHLQDLEKKGHLPKAK